MNSKISLKVNIRKRTGKKSLAALRREGLVPGVVYGNKIVNVLVSVKGADFIKAFKEAGENTLVDLKIGDEAPRTVLIHDVAVDPVKQNAIHVDFYQVRLDQEVKTEVPLVFIGVSKAVKELNGSLVKLFQSLEVESLPADIPSEIIVDVSQIESFDKNIKVKDLNIGANVKASANPEEVVAMVSPPRTEQDIEELKEDVVEDVDKVEGVADDEAVGEEASSSGKADTAISKDKDKKEKEHTPKTE